MLTAERASADERHLAGDPKQCPLVDSAQEYSSLLPSPASWECIRTVGLDVQPLGRYDVRSFSITCMIYSMFGEVDRRRNDLKAEDHRPAIHPNNFRPIVNYPSRCIRLLHPSVSAVAPIALVIKPWEVPHPSTDVQLPATSHQLPRITIGKVGQVGRRKRA